MSSVVLVAGGIAGATVARWIYAYVYPDDIKADLGTVTEMVHIADVQKKPLYKELLQEAKARRSRIHWDIVRVSLGLPSRQLHCQLHAPSSPSKNSPPSSNDDDNSLASKLYQRLRERRAMIQPDSAEKSSHDDDNDGLCGLARKAATRMLRNAVVRDKLLVE